MAVDTASKRFSMMRLTEVGSVFPPQTSGLSDSEKLAVLGLYVGFELVSGILILTFDADVIVSSDLAYDSTIGSDFSYDRIISADFVYDVRVV